MGGTLLLATKLKNILFTLHVCYIHNYCLNLNFDFTIEKYEKYPSRLDNVPPENNILCWFKKAK